MPKHASRLWLEVTEIRQEQLQKITGEDAYWEGFRHEEGFEAEAKANFKLLWDEINKKPGTCWQDNPLVWVIRFRMIKP